MPSALRYQKSPKFSVRASAAARAAAVDAAYLFNIALSLQPAALISPVSLPRLSIHRDAHVCRNICG